MFGIVVDSSADLSPAWCEAHDVTLVPLSLTVEADRCKDLVDETALSLTDRDCLDWDSVTATRPDPLTFATVFERMLKTGFNSIVCVCASTLLARTCESAWKATRLTSEPGAIEVVDSKTTSAGEALVVCSLVKARDAGMSFSEAVEAAREMVGEITSAVVASPRPLAAMRRFHTTFMSRVRLRIASLLDRYVLLTINGNGEPLVVAMSDDRGRLLGRIARLMALDAHRLGHLDYLALTFGPEDGPELRGYLAKNPDWSRANAELVPSVANARFLGVDAVGVAYVPSDR